MLPRPRRMAAVAEGLAYVGGMLGVLGLVLFAVRSWNDFSLVARLALSGASAAVLAFGGLVISDERQPASVRLRQFLWTGSTACLGVASYVAGEEWLNANEDPRRVAVVAAGVALASGVFWWWRRGALQHVSGLAALAVGTGAVAHEIWDAGAAGATVWLVGVAYVWVALTLEEAGNWITGTLGGIAAVGGALFASQEWTGVALLVGVASSAALIFLASMFIGPNDGILRVGFTVVGVWGMVQCTPPAIAHYAEEAGVNTGLVVSILGILLVLAGFTDLTFSGEQTTAIRAIAALAVRRSPGGIRGLRRLRCRTRRVVGGGGHHTWASFGGGIGPRRTDGVRTVGNRTLLPGRRPRATHRVGGGNSDRRLGCAVVVARQKS